MTRFTEQDNHLMMVIDNMIKDLTGADTFPHSNTIRVAADGISEVLQATIEQVPVLNMHMYKVNPKNMRENPCVDVHIVLFGFHRSEHAKRLGIGLNGKKE